MVVLFIPQCLLLIVLNFFVHVYTVIDGFVASAGTLIALAGEKRYMLIHELHSGMWGKMTEINDEYCNLKRLMKHIIKIYVNNTNLTKSNLTEILKKRY